MKFFITSLFLLLVNITCISPNISAANLSSKKILHIDSYHQGYPWSDGIARGIANILNAHNLEFKSHYMNTKINKKEEDKKLAALEAKRVIEEFKPDIIIATDDNASKYLISPYYKNTNLPVIFAGINWSADEYGFPTKNITGMIEVTSIDELLAEVKNITTAEKVSVLSADSFSNHKEIKHIKNMLGISFHKEEYVSTFNDWQNKFLELQNTSDVIYIRNMQGINDFNKEKAISFIKNNTKKLVISTNDFLQDYAAISFAKLPEEQGEWAANTALKVLKGHNISDINITRNKKGRIIINEYIVNKLKLQIPIHILEIAEITP